MLRTLWLFIPLFLFGACALVEVTATRQETYPPTAAEDVEILFTVPSDRPYLEIAAVTVAGYDADDMAGLHAQLRQKSAPLGAEAVIILNQGINDDEEMWATGVCIRWLE